MNRFVKGALVALGTAALVEAPHLAAGYAFGRVFTSHGYTERMFDENWNSQPRNFTDARAFLTYPGVKIAYKMHSR